MRTLIAGSRTLLVCGLLGWAFGCAEQDGGNGPSHAGASVAPRPVTSNATGSHQGAAGSGVPMGIAGSPAAAGAPAAMQGNGAPSMDGCAANAPFKKEGCPCRAGETAACWTGPAADRNVGKCHDGLQICTASGEFASWGPCMGEELSCGSDAGIPQLPDSGVPPPPEQCNCIPGAVVQCSEDCSVGIICSLTATKTCLPDRTWSVCREDIGATLDLPGVQCRNMLHGCFDVLTEGAPAGQGEIYVGDCSKQFECGHAPTFLPAVPSDDAE